MKFAPGKFCRSAAARAWRRRSRHRNEPGRRRHASDGFSTGFRLQLIHSHLLCSLLILRSYEDVRSLAVRADGARKVAIRSRSREAEKQADSGRRDAEHGKLRRPPKPLPWRAELHPVATDAKRPPLARVLTADSRWSRQGYVAGTSVCSENGGRTYAPASSRLGSSIDSGVRSS